jgi:acyl-CoA reductase-like NAD-dependent aldehyde dehydrogenase
MLQAQAITQLAQYQMLIGGDWTDARDGERLATTNPFTGRPWAVAPRAGASDVDAAVVAARAALAGPWGSMTASERGPDAAARVAAG